MLAPVGPWAGVVRCFRMRTEIRLLGAALAVALCAYSADPPVRAWQGSIALPTWEEGAPDETPTFDVLSPGRSWYPYPTRSRLGKQRRNEEWRTLNLENEYLACTVLPDLGGHLYRCLDKLSGYEMFHANPSIKKALVGLRGAWAAAGVELNFPIGHTLLTVSPVDFGVVQGKDSASVWVGATDRTTGMRWAVEFSLETGSAVVRQNVFLENPTPVRHRYYWWTNAGITPQEDTRFIVPTRLVANHGFTNVDTWPLSTTRVDRSVVAGYSSGLGLFAHGSREPFLAVYHPKSRTGTLHYADPAIVPGKKTWTWGREDGKQYREELTDNNSNYVEIQAGLFPNQETFAFFAPWQARSFTEYWMPVRKLDGISQASLDGVLYLDRRDGALVAQFLPTHALPGAKVRILNDANPVLEQTADLDPASMFSRTIPNPQPGPHTFQLLDSAGKLLLAHTEGEYRGLAPGAVKLGPQPQRDWDKVSTERDYLDRAEYNELQAQFHFAANDYTKALGMFPNSMPLLKGAGRLAVGMKRYADAVTYFSAVRKTAPADAESRYYLGLALAGQGQDEEARREWMTARGDPEFGPPATLEIAAALARSGDYNAAADALRSPLSLRPKLARAGVVEAALLRAAGDTDRAGAALARVRQLDPTDFVARYEQVRQGVADDTLWEHLAADPERVLEIADLYMHWGLYADAMAALEYKYPLVPSNRTEPGAVPPQDYPLVAYYRGYCRERLGQDAGEDFRAASVQQVRYVFPNRAGTLPVLLAAIERNPSDATAHYLLGLMYLDSRLVAEAAAEWQAVQKARPGFPEAAAMLALVRPVLARAPAPASVLAPPRASRAPASAPEPAAAFHGPPREIALAALLTAASGNLSRALEAFSASSFPEEKQEDVVREAYIELQLQRLLALAAARRCDVVDNELTHLGFEDKSLPFTFHGFGAFMKGVRFQYLVGVVEAACGEDKSARKRWERLAKARPQPSSPDYAFPYLALARLKPDEAGAQAQAGLAEVRRGLAAADPASRPALLYSQGLLLMTLGKTEEAAASFQEGANALPAGVLQYLNADALRTMSSGRR